MASKKRKPQLKYNARKCSFGDIVMTNSTGELWDNIWHICIKRKSTATNWLFLTITKGKWRI
jgi:hypothetical protein